MVSRFIINILNYFDLFGVCTEHEISLNKTVFGVNDFMNFANAALIYFSVLIESTCKRLSQQQIWFIYKQIYSTSNPIPFTTLKCMVSEGNHCQFFIL